MGILLPWIQPYGSRISTALSLVRSGDNTRDIIVLDTIAPEVGGGDSRLASPRNAKKTRMGNPVTPKSFISLSNQPI
jgi:hypothetical protein